MPTISCTIPVGDPMITLAAVAATYLDAHNIPRVGLTPDQLVQRYIVEVLKSVYVTAKTNASHNDVQATVNAATATAQVAAGGIV